MQELCGIFLSLSFTECSVRSIRGLKMIVFPASGNLVPAACITHWLRLQFDHSVYLF